MVICSKCGNEVKNGKFCTKCGAPLEVQNNNEIRQATNDKFCPNCGAKVTGKFCVLCGTKIEASSFGRTKSEITKSKSGFLNGLTNEISKKVGNIATALTAIKSNYKNGTILYWVEKIPNVKEKQIIVSDDETAFINQGAGFKKVLNDRLVQDDNFECYYIKNNTKINFASSEFSFPTSIKKISSDNEIDINIRMSIDLVVEDIEKFTSQLISLRKESWTTLSFYNNCFSGTNDKIKELLVNEFRSNGGIVINRATEQIEELLSPIQDVIKEELKKCFVRLENCEIISVDFDYDKANEIMINDLYK